MKKNPSLDSIIPNGESKRSMYELEFIPTCTLEESTWIQHESKELTQDLLDFIENEFEDKISDFEMVIVYEEGCYNLPVNVIRL
jgi:hypothetical protein